MNTQTIKPKIAKAVRILTVAPIIAAALILILYFCTDTYTPTHMAAAILFLCVFPLISYPISLIYNKEDRRRKQRTLAIIFSVVGYVAGSIFCFAAKGSANEKTVYLTYLFSGILTALFSFVFKIKSSGHACGVAGPIAALSVLVSPLFLLSLPLLAAVFLSSLLLKRHTLSQLALGSVIPVLCLFLSMALCR